jgi:hypothetical protein
MGNLLNTSSKTSPPTQAGQQELRNFRQSYLDYLASEQGRAIQDQTNKYLTPESANDSLTIIKQSQTYLQQNPNANILELQSSKDTCTIQLKRIRETNKPKSYLQSIVNGIPGINEEYGVQQKLITSQQQSSLAVVGSSLNSWLKSNNSATLIDYNQKIQEIRTSINGIFTDPTVQKQIQGAIEALTKLTPQEADQQSKELKDKTKDNLRLEFKSTDVLTTTISVATQVFMSFFLILLIIFCGSLAANQAIGRDPVYRVIYFIWGMVFFPLVAIQCLLQRLRVGPIPMYGILPVSTEAATTRLGKLLWAPFYWIPDVKSDTLRDEYLKSLTKFV